MDCFISVGSVYLFCLLLLYCLFGVVLFCCCFFGLVVCRVSVLLLGLFVFVAVGLIGLC